MIAGLAIVAAIALLDALVWKNAVVIGLLIVGPLVAATRSSRRAVLVVSATALVAAVLLGFPDHVFGTTEHGTRLLVVIAGGALAVWSAGIREDRERTAHLLGTQAAVARLLMSCDSLHEAAPRLLATIGQMLDWRLGALWTTDARGDSLVCAEVWAAPEAKADAFLSQTRASVFHRGEGLPGRVWISGQAEWLSDFGDDGTFPRHAAAAEADIRTAFGFPIIGAGGTLGAVEFFAADIRPPDRALLDLSDVLGVQLGEYVERRAAESAMTESEALKTAVVQAALDCIITMDSRGRILELNPAGERMLGYTAEEVVGRELAELIIPPDLRERHRAGLARYLETRESRLLDRRVQLRAMRKDGSEFPVELTITSTDVEPPIFTGYLRDLSERREAEELQQRLAAIVESSDDAILSKDTNLIVRSWNRAAQRLYGYTIEEAVGMPIHRIIPEHRKGEEVAILERVMAEGRIEHYDTERVRKDGTQVDVSLTVSPLHDPETGELVGASVIARDITERKRVERRRAELLRIEQETRLRTQLAEQRASFLAEAQSLLSSSLDFEVTLRTLAELAVPSIADWCAVDIVGPDGSLDRLVLVHADPQKQRLAADLEKNYPPRENAERGALRAVLSRQSELIRQIPPELIEARVQSEEHRRMVEQLGLRSAMVVPLLARERALGAISFVSAESGREFDEDDLALAEDLAARAAIAADNARLYGERSYIASTLQQSLMPENLPEVPGVEIAARYAAAGEGNEVGGDFYDIYRSSESTWGLAIGDVRGKGPAAAAVTSLARYTLRTASLSETLPSRVLRILNEALLRERATDRFCTVAFASIGQNDRGGIDMTLGVGGHPLPLLLKADGSVHPVGTPGTLIGLVPDPDIVDEAIPLCPGDSLILYTDGVSEARSREGLFGEERLMDLLRRCSGLDPAELAEKIEHDVLDFQEGATKDDLAVLVLRVRDDQKHARRMRTSKFEPASRAHA